MHCSLSVTPPTFAPPSAEEHRYDTLLRHSLKQQRRCTPSSSFCAVASACFRCFVDYPATVITLHDSLLRHNHLSPLPDCITMCYQQHATPTLLT